MSRIEELEKRLAADPNSRIFVQLAEEYRKQGLLENAIEVCEEGLKKHPQYPSARVALGRALLEAESFDRAGEEFETVLAQVPDNILANKFLGETYHRLGRFDEAVQKYQIAQTLAPEDTELEEKIQAVKSDMAGGGPAPLAAVDPSEETEIARPGEMVASPPPPPPPVPQAAPPPPESTPLEATLVDGPQQAPPTDHTAAPPLPPAPPAPELHDAVAEAPAEASEPVPEAPEEDLAPIPLVDVSEPMVLEGPAYARSGEIPEEAEPTTQGPPQPPPPEVVSPFEAVAEQERAFEAPVSETEQVFEAPGPEPEQLFEAPTPEPDQVFEPPPVVPAPPPEPEPRVPEIVAEPAPLSPSVPELAPPPPPSPDEIETPTMAELYASQGHFDRAVAVYRNLLVRSPNETQYLERIEELEMLANAAAASNQQAPAAVHGASGDGLSDESRRKTIAVLEQWLHAIRGSRRS